MANEQNFCILIRLPRRISAAASGMIPQVILAHMIWRKPQLSRQGGSALTGIEAIARQKGAL